MFALLLLVCKIWSVYGNTEYITLSNETVHWGYFSKNLEPIHYTTSGSTIVVEMSTHHACDDWDLMIKGDEGMESVFTWSETLKAESFRGASGTGDGVHVLTGPIYVEGAEPGDVLKVEILDLEPRFNPDGKFYASNAAAWWGFQARVKQVDGSDFDAGDFTGTPNSNDEFITIYELVQDAESKEYYTKPSYQFLWPTLTDPDGVERNFIQYPGTCVPHDPHGDTVPSSDVADMGWTKSANIEYFDDVVDALIPVNFHVGCMGLPPASHDSVDSIPPMPTGGNLDDKRIGIGTTMYYPVEVEGALLSMGDAHMAQGDSELDGTGVEASLTGTFRVTVIKANDLNDWQKELDYPMGETDTHWIVHSFTEIDYLDTYFDNPSDIYGASSIDPAMKNIFMQTRKFMETNYGMSDQEATSYITQGVDFGITQLVDGNWGMHSEIPKATFDGVALTNTAPLNVSSLGTPDLTLSAETVHWGYFSKSLEPVLTIEDGAEIVVEMSTHHACDDYDKMIKGDQGMESIYEWSSTFKAEDFRGATGGGDGVHILTGPIFVSGAEPGDILKVEIIDLLPRANPDGKTYGSNAAAWWGFQARVNESDGTAFDAGTFTGTPGSNDEYITIYEILQDLDSGNAYAVPSYQFEWPTITDPNGVERDYIAYPGTCVPHDSHGDTVPSTAVSDLGWSKADSITYYDSPFPAKIPINFHIGCMGLAPASHESVDSIPPLPSGGNLDNKRIGIGSTMYYPVEVAGALLSMGDTHAAQGDSELDGTGIETSLTGKFKISVIKSADFNDWQKILDFPLGETNDHWVVNSFTEIDYLETFSENPGDIYGVSNLDDAMKNTFSQTRKFIMAAYNLTEREAITVITNGVDFGVAQVVDGNWGMFSEIPKSLFESKMTESAQCPSECAVQRGRKSRELLFGYFIDCSGCFD